METKLKFGLSQAYQYAPKWLINTMSVISLVIAAKHYIVDGLPILAVEDKLLVNDWLNYLLDLSQVLLALAVIFFGQHRKGNYYDPS